MTFDPMYVPAQPTGLPPTNDPQEDYDPCEAGDHPDVEDGYCLACGEYTDPYGVC